MLCREELDWSIYQYYDVKMIKPDNNPVRVQPSSTLTSLNDSEEIMKTMIKRERNRFYLVENVHFLNNYLFMLELQLPSAERRRRRSCRVCLPPPSSWRRATAA